MAGLLRLRIVTMVILSAVIFFDITRGEQTTYDQGLNGLSDEVIMDPKKRVFCNNFGGCGGRKRTELSPQLYDLLSQRQFYDQRQDFNERPSPTKRVFCNGFSGCGGGGKRSYQPSQMYALLLGKQLQDDETRHPDYSKMLENDQIRRTLYGMLE